MILASSSYHFPWIASSYLFVFFICQLLYVLFNVVYTSSSFTTVLTMTVIFLSISYIFTSSPKESVSTLLSLSLSMTNTGPSSTIVGTPMILVVMLVFIAVTADLWASLD